MYTYYIVNKERAAHLLGPLPPPSYLYGSVPTLDSNIQLLQSSKGTSSAPSRSASTPGPLGHRRATSASARSATRRSRTWTSSSWARAIGSQ